MQIQYSIILSEIQLIAMRYVAIYFYLFIVFVCAVIVIFHHHNIFIYVSNMWLIINEYELVTIFLYKIEYSAFNC